MGKKANRRKAIIEHILSTAEEADENVGFIGDIKERDLYADAIVGLTYHPAKLAVVYDYDLLVEAFKKTLDTDRSGAIDYIEFNVTTGWPYGKKATKPIIIEKVHLF